MKKFTPFSCLPCRKVTCKLTKGPVIIYGRGGPESKVSRHQKYLKVKRVSIKKKIFPSVCAVGREKILRKKSFDFFDRSLKSSPSSFNATDKTIKRMDGLYPYLQNVCEHGRILGCVNRSKQILQLAISLSYEGVFWFSLTSGFSS